MKVHSLFQRLYDDWEIYERRSVATMSINLRHVDDFLGDRDANKLTTDDIRQYVLARKREGAKNATVNRELATLRRAYKLAMGAGVVQRMPLIQRLPENNVRQGTYTREDVERLCAELPAHLVPVVWFAFHTGRRRNEILQVAWSDVDLKRKLITIRQGTTKTTKPDQIPLEGELYEFMARLAEERTQGCDLVFHKEGQPIGPFSHTFSRAAQRAGLPGKLFHDFRRSVATDLLEAGVDEQTAMRVTGHKTSSMFRRYRIVPQGTVRTGLKKLQDYREGK